MSAADGLAVTRNLVVLHVGGEPTERDMERHLVRRLVRTGYRDGRHVSRPRSARARVAHRPGVVPDSQRGHLVTRAHVGDRLCAARAPGAHARDLGAPGNLARLDLPVLSRLAGEYERRIDFESQRRVGGLDDREGGVSARDRGLCRAGANPRGASGGVRLDLRQGRDLHRLDSLRVTVAEHEDQLLEVLLRVLATPRFLKVLGPVLRILPSPANLLNPPNAGVEMGDFGDRVPEDNRANAGLELVARE